MRIYMLYNNLTSYFSKINKNKFKPMTKRGLQHDIIVLLDIYKQNYDTYKSLLTNSSDKSQLLKIQNNILLFKTLLKALLINHTLIISFSLTLILNYKL